MTQQTKHGPRPDIVEEFERRLRIWRAELAVELRSDLEASAHQSYSEVVGEVRDSGDESNAEILSHSERMELSRHFECIERCRCRAATATRWRFWRLFRLRRRDQYRAPASLSHRDALRGLPDAL